MTRARRPNNYITAALKRRYALAKGELLATDLFADQERIHGDLAHLGAVVRMFDPQADLAAIKPIRPYMQNRRNDDKHALFSIGCSLQAVLARRVTEGTVQRHGKPARWAAVRD